MIQSRNNIWRTSNDDIYVGSRKIAEIRVGNRMVYPDYYDPSAGDGDLLYAVYFEFPSQMTDCTAYLTQDDYRAGRPSNIEIEKAGLYLYGDLNLIDKSAALVSFKRGKNHYNKYCAHIAFGVTPIQGQTLNYSSVRSRQYIVFRNYVLPDWGSPRLWYKLVAGTEDNQFAEVGSTNKHGYFQTGNTVDIMNPEQTEFICNPESVLNTVSVHSRNVTVFFDENDYLDYLLN